MATSADYSSNSESLIGEPLDTLQIPVNAKNGLSPKVPAISIGFMAPRHYIHFKLPPTLSDNDTGQDGLTADEEEWLECVSLLEEDLMWVLKLPYHRFWSQVIYDEKLQKCLESYLIHAPRNYDISNLHCIDSISSYLNNIHKLVFLVYLRMSTYKESKNHHITPKIFGEIIYDNFLFDIPKIMDLCVLYGNENAALLKKMIDNIFTTQPQYFTDLNDTLEIILIAFHNIEEKVLSGTLSFNDFQDVINYLADVSITIYSFLEMFPQACEHFYNIGTIERISIFYEHVITAVENDIKSFDESESLSEDIKKKISLSKTLLIKIFRIILDNCLIQNIINSRLTNEFDASSENLYLESLLDIFIVRTEEKTFLCDYNKIFPFDSDLELFSTMQLVLDSSKTRYIMSSVHDIDQVSEKFVSAAANGALPKIKQDSTSEIPTQNFQDIAAVLSGVNSKIELQEEACASGSTSFDIPNETEMTSLIQYVIDVIPFGEGFIEKCLHFFSYDPEKTINALLTDTLPPFLEGLDRTMERDLNQKNQVQKSSILSERKNVFDNDEFDVFNTTNVNMKNIHKGKKNKTPGSYESISKDSESSSLKETILIYGSQETENDLYDDEYDDTYDSLLVGMKEPVPEGEPEKEEIVEEPVDEKRKNDFCVDPAILREQREARRQTQASRGRRIEQSHNEERTRQQKDRNKAKVGNHNRHRQADFKKSRGMMPF